MDSLLLSPSVWVPGTFPIPFFQTWCCKNSALTPTSSLYSHNLKDSGLPPKMYDCVVSNLIHNRVGVDCIHYLYNDADCRAFIQTAFPPDVVAAYDRLIPTAFKADLWRYCVLYKFGGVYLDVKYKTQGPTLRDIVERWGGTASQRRNCDALLASFDESRTEFVRCVAPGVLPPYGDGGGGCVGYGSDDLLCLERDAVDLWAPGHFGIHNAFIITKPKNPLFLECIFRIVTLSRGGGGGGGGGDFSAGWMTRPLFVTGPGLLGDVWRDVRWGARSTMAVPNSYATMAPYFRFFFEGNGIISYFIDPEKKGLDGTYIQFLKVYDEYNQEVAGGSGSGVPHYTILWSRGIVWGVPPPNGGSSGGSAPQRR